MTQVKIFPVRIYDDYEDMEEAINRWLVQSRVTLTFIKQSESEKDLTISIWYNK